MTLHLVNHDQEKSKICNGSILMITMFVVLILGFVLGAYLYLVKQESAFVTRSQAWNSALLMAEAGIEEGMAQINSGLGTNNMGSAKSNGWAGPSLSGIYGPKKITWNNGYYVSTITITSSVPIITATGYVTIPALSATVSRTVQLAASPTPAFLGGMVSLLDVDLKGNNIYVDSYDSNDPKHSTNGLYYYPWRKAGGDVASTLGTVNIGNADIKGKVYTGPGGTYSILKNGSVGDLNWAGPGVQDGWFKNDFNADFPDVQAPYSTGFNVPASTKVSGTNVIALSGNTQYITSTLDLKTGDLLLVTGTNTTLYVTGNLTMSGSSSISIAPGASLTVYVGGASTTFTSVNTTGSADTFQYYGLPTNTQVTWNGNDFYRGTVYAPEAVFTLGGGGSNTYDYQGACVVKSAKMNGKFNFHYDEGLKNKIYLGFSGSWWKEI